ncbi:MAG TPA: serine/threonine-protein kinase [Gammaproteobacteria bacterium]
MNRPKRLLRRRGAPLLVFGVALALLAASGFFETVEDGAYAAGMRLSAPRRASERFAVVTIDAEAAREAGEWPWPGPRLAELVNRIHAAGARAIAWMLPPDRETSPAVTATLERLAGQLPENSDAQATLVELRQRLDSNAALASAFSAGGRVLLGVPASERGGDPATARILMPLQLRHVVADDNDIALPAGFRPPEFPPLEIVRQGFEAPEPPVFEPGPLAAELPAAVTGTGLVPPNDAVWRQPLVWRVNGAYLPSLPLLMAAAAQELGAADLLVVKGQGIALGENWLPTGTKLEALPYFYPASGSGAVTRIDATAVLGEGFDATRLRDRVVLIGLANGTTLHTPVDAVSPAVGVAQTAASLYSGDVYHRPAWGGWLLLALWLAIAAWLLAAVPRLGTRNALIGTAMFALLLVILELGLLISQSLWLPLMTPVIALALGHLVLHGHGWLHARRAAQAQAVSNAYLALGEALRAAGQLDRAFDALQNCLPDDTVERQLHDLGLDYERKRHYAKALRVYHRLKSIAPRYPELDMRINRLQALEETSLRSRRSGPIETVALEDAGNRTPRIGRYDIQRELGRGAMGVVYLGKDSRIGREVAIKTLAFSDEFSGEALDAVKERFYREAEAAGRLSHPNIVTIYDVGEEDDLAYIAMDYLRGEALCMHAKEDNLLPLERVMRIAAHVADALHYAHEQGVVHRDVKPANMVLTKDEHEVKVTDFGVAHLTDASKTKTGTILGSPSFMSPEQVAGRRVDGRSDLWSLGVSMYQLLTGHLPFTGEPLATLMYRIANEDASELRAWRPDIPDNVNAIVTKALTKDPSARYQTGRGMAGAIRQCIAKLEGAKA